VTGGGVSADNRSWCPARKRFLFPPKALAKLVRGKLRATLRRRRPDLVLPRTAWRKPWVVHITPWSEGDQAVLDYLARYVFRVAITNTRITGLDAHTVTIRYKQRKSSRWRTCRIAGEEFIRRFLQHVLPKGFHKIRYFGLWHPRNRDLAARVRLLLRLDRPTPPETAAEGPPATEPNDQPALANPRSADPPLCPHCQLGHLILIGRLTRETRWDRDPPLPTPLPSPPTPRAPHATAFVCSADTRDLFPTPTSLASRARALLAAPQFPTRDRDFSVLPRHRHNGRAANPLKIP
jgi:hypothetical protein